MATGVTRDPHNLRRNLSLNGNYLSNDGANEGITVANDGVVTMTNGLDLGSEDLTMSNLSLSTTGANGTIDTSIGDLTISSNAVKVAVGASQTVTIEHGAAVPLALFSVDGVTLYSSSVDTIGFSTGSSMIRLKSLQDTDDYIDIACSTNGALNITTLDAVGKEADITMTANGHIRLYTNTDEDIKLDSGNDIILDAATGVTKLYKIGDEAEYTSLTVGDDAGLTIQSTSASPYADITLDPKRYSIFKKNGTNILQIASAGGYSKITCPQHLKFQTNGTDDDIVFDAKRYPIVLSDGATFTPTDDVTSSQVIVEVP